jgi:hypothetical protein
LGAIGGGTGHGEQVSEFGSAALTAVKHGDQVLLLTLVEFGLLPDSRPSPWQLSSVCGCEGPIRSAWNSVTIAETCKSDLPTGSVGSYTDPRRLSRTTGTVSRWVQAPRSPAPMPMGKEVHDRIDEKRAIDESCLIWLSRSSHTALRE